MSVSVFAFETMDEHVIGTAPAPLTTNGSAVVTVAVVVAAPEAIPAKLVSVTVPVEAIF
jgi:hypothetical protein